MKMGSFCVGARSNTWLTIAMVLVALCCHSFGFAPLPQPICDYHGTCYKKELLGSEYLPLSAAQEQQDISGRDAPSNSSYPAVTGVTLKMAFDSNWAVADNAEQQSERFTSPASLDLVHRLRRDSDAVLVGRTTVERDNCTLTVRRVALATDKEQPVRVVVDPNLQLLNGELGEDSMRYALFHDGLETIVYCSNKAVERLDIQLPKGILLVPLPTANDNEKLSATTIIKDLNDNRDIHHVMVEGGPATARKFLQSNLVDRAILIRAPIAFTEPVESGMSTDTLTNSGLELLGTTTSEGDVVEYWSRPELAWPTSDLADWP